MPQISELFSTYLSSGGRFNTLVESLLDAMSCHERSLSFDSPEGLIIVVYKARQP